MGSFASTCCISGLPIECGDDVRCMLLTETPYKNERPCSSNSLWIPRTFPLRGRYNDYGSVEGVEASPERQLWLDGLNLDLVERDWGDNSCHDVPVRKNMSWDDLLTALQEQRVLVKNEWEGELSAMLGPLRRARQLLREKLPEAAQEFGKILENPKPKTPPGVPTRARIEKALQAAGLPLYGGTGQGGYLVNKIRYGFVRVRVQHWSTEAFGKDAEFLAKVQTLLEPTYATMIAAGEGAYAHNAELLVRPKPGTEGYHGHRKRPEEPLRVILAMIREDVWKALVGVAFKDDCGRSVHLTEKVEEFLRNPPYILALQTHWRLMREKYDDDETKIPADFRQTAAEFIYIQRLLAMTRYYWRSGYNIGPQFGEWGTHEKVLKALHGVAKIHKEEG